MTTSDSVRPLTAAEEAELRTACARIPAASPAAHTIDRLLATLDEARAGSLDAAALGRGILASVQLRLFAGDVDATYSPADVARIVSEAVDQQVERAAALREAQP